MEMFEKEERVIVSELGEVEFHSPDGSIFAELYAVKFYYDEELVFFIVQWLT